MVSEKLVRNVVLAALRGETGDAGWLTIDSKATKKELSLAIMEAESRGLVRATDVSTLGARLEWKLLGPTGASAQFIRDTSSGKKLWVIVVGGVVVIIGFLAWLISVLISLYIEIRSERAGTEPRRFTVAIARY